MSSSATFSWNDFWSYFNLQSSTIKASLLQQIDIVKFLKGLSAKYQAEVLESAPPELVSEVETILYLETRIILGLAKKPARTRKVNVNRLISRIG